MRFENAQYQVEVIDEPFYGNASNDQSRHYAIKYLVGEDFANDTRYGVIAKNFYGASNSCLIVASGSGPKVHANSAIVLGNNLFLAIGNRVCCLELLSMSHQWQKRADRVACFGIYISPDNEGIISHGECDILRLSFGGKIEWTVTANDIFSEKLVLLPDRVIATSPNHEEYSIAISDGYISQKDGT